MSLRFTRSSHVVGLLVTLLVASVWFTSTWAASIFQNGQKASLVLGQSGFSSSTAQTSQDGLRLPIAINIDPLSKKSLCCRYLKQSCRSLRLF
jgi:hypothetical protein